MNKAHTMQESQGGCYLSDELGRIGFAVGPLGTELIEHFPSFDHIEDEIIAIVAILSDKVLENRVNVGVSSRSGNLKEGVHLSLKGGEIRVVLGNLFHRHPLARPSVDSLVNGAKGAQTEGLVPIHLVQAVDSFQRGATLEKFHGMVASQLVFLTDIGRGIKAARGHGNQGKARRLYRRRDKGAPSLGGFHHFFLDVVLLLGCYSSQRGKGHRSGYRGKGVLGSLTMATR